MPGGRIRVTVPLSSRKADLRRELLLDNILEGNSVGGEFANALAQLLHGHLLLVEVEAEERLVVNIRLLLDVE